MSGLASGLRTLNALPAAAAEAELASCCGARRWARVMTAARPFASPEELFAAAQRIWRGLEPGDWLEAFRAHPRIGERAEPDTGTDDSGVRARRAWSRGEQAGVDGADAATRAALVEGNRAYERRFGYLFLVCATGKSAAELLAILERRLANDPQSELRVAAAEQEEITRLRLEKLLLERMA